LIGRQTVRRLLARGDQITTLQRGGFDGEVTEIRGSITDAGAVEFACADQDAVVLNVASPSSQPRRVLSGAGLRQLAWSPDGRWLLVSWPAADQWVFVRVAGMPRIAAVSRIARQFSARSAQHAFPRIEGWCCTASGNAG